MRPPRTLGEWVGAVWVLTCVGTILGGALRAWGEAIVRWLG